MKKNRTRLLWALCLSIALVPSPSSAQTRKAPVARTPARPLANEPVPTFDTLLAADSYKVYSEVRGVGQLIRSTGVNDLLDPIMKLAGPPKEFRTVVKWLNTHADEIMTSRMMFASWPTRPGLPSFICALEFSSNEAARDFDLQLKAFLPKVLPTPSPSASPEPSPRAPIQKSQVTEPSSPNPQPPYVIRHSGNLVLISDSVIRVAKLRPLGSKLLTESQNFRLARDRFGSESLFVYFNIELPDKSYESPVPAESPSPQRVESVRGEQAREVRVTEPTLTPEVIAQPQVIAPEPTVDETTSQTITTVNEGSALVTSETPKSDNHSADLAMLLGRVLDGGRPTWPEAVGLAVAFEPESYVIRVFLVNSPLKRGVNIPFIPQLASGPAIVPSAPSILPSDTELFVTASLDYMQIYEGVGKNLANENEANRRHMPQTGKETVAANPFAPYEKMLGINLKDDLIPLLGNEFAVSVPLKSFTGSGARPEEKPEEGSAKTATRSSSSPILIVSIRDRDAVRALIPKLISSLGFKDANMLAQTERRDDTELVNYANVVAYAFIGDFIVLSADSSAVRHVVDSYLNGQTLASDAHFRNSTRWQPRQVLGQIYVSPGALETYTSLTPDMTTSLSAKMVEFLMSLGSSSEAITYALSNEGLGPLHELHLPKRLIVLMLAGVSGGAEQSREGANEAVAQSSLRSIVSAEATYQATTGNGKYGSLEELIANGLISKDMMEKYGYRIEIRSSGDRFESSAVPVEYGKTGKTSFFVDESGVLRAGDHGGGPATIADKALQ